MSRLTAEARKLDSEEATAYLLADCYGDANTTALKMVRSKQYRKEHGILFADQIEVIARVEYTCEDMSGVGRGIFWRSHPQGRTLSQSYGAGGSYYV